LAEAARARAPEATEAMAAGAKVGRSDEGGGGECDESEA
jgi:hypothetical protein